MTKANSKMKRLLALTVILSVLPLTKTNAQETGQDKLGSWRMFFGNVRLSERISISPEIQYRTYEVGEHRHYCSSHTGISQ